MKRTKLPKKKIERQKKLFDRLLAHLRESVQPRERVLVELLPSYMGSFKRAHEERQEMPIDPFNEPVSRGWGAILKTIWEKGAEAVSIESAHAVHQMPTALEKLFPERKSLGELLVSRQRERLIAVPLRERIIAKKTARERQGSAQVRRLIGGCAHKYFLPGLLRKHGIRTRKWKYNQRPDDATIRTINLAYYEYGRRIDGKKAMHRARQREKRKMEKPRVKRLK